MCGYYAPVKQQVDVSVSAKRMVDQFEAMSDAELLRLADQAEPAGGGGVAPPGHDGYDGFGPFSRKSLSRGDL